MVTTEKRHAGGMLQIVYKDKVLAIQDSVKPEISSGVYNEGDYLILPEKYKLNTFAGGQQGREGLRRNLWREVREEMKELNDMDENLHIRPVGIRYDSHATQILYPFLVGQFSKDPAKETEKLKERIKGIDETAVTVVHMPWERLSRKVQAPIIRALDGGLAQWENIEAVARLREPNADARERNKFRPQFITAASLYVLQEAGNSEEELVELTRFWNQNLLLMLKEISDTEKWPINNGTFNQTTGAMQPDLSKRMTQYLLPTIKKSYAQ